MPQLAQTLRQDGYDESAIRRVLDLPDVPGIDHQCLPGLVRRCQDEGSPAAAWIGFWLLGQPRAESGAWAESLLELGLLAREGDLLRARCSLSPCLGVYILADPLEAADGVNGPGSRAYALARLTPRGASGPALDFMCGPGTQTVLNALGGQPSCGVDPNPRALAFGRLNAQLNSSPGCHFQEELPGGEFALITACLPFLNPARGELPQGPSPQLVAALTERLQLGGTLALACSYPVCDTPPLSQLGPGWGVLQVSYAQGSLERYAALLVDRARLLEAFGQSAGEEAYELEVCSRLQDFERASLRGMEDAVFLIRRLEGGGCRRQVTCPYPLTSLAEQVQSEDWRPDEPPTSNRWTARAPARLAQSQLARALGRYGYAEEGLRSLLGMDEPIYSREQRAGLIYRTSRQDSPLAHLCAFWLLEQARPRQLLEQLLGSELVELLEGLGLIREGRAQAMLFPCLGHYLFTDLLFAPRQDQVYWLGPDSLALARCAPRSARGRSLDLCTGCGVQAILNASHCREAWAVDLNPRALEYCRHNARLNAVSLTVVESDLYAAVPPGKFELITANPPFVPTPQSGLRLFRPGGESGEELTAAIVRGLPERLEVGGTLALVSQCPKVRGSDPLDRLEGWLGASQGWGLAQLRLGHLNRESLIAGHVTSPGEFEEWLESYARQGIEGADLAVTFVRRLEPDRPGWRAEAQLEMPLGNVSDRVEAWLAGSG